MAAGEGIVAKRLEDNVLELVKLFDPQINLVLQNRNRLSGDVPDENVIDFVVLMNEKVSEVYDLSRMINSRVSFGKVVNDSREHFANDDEVSFNSTAELRLGQVILQRLIAYELAQL